ncbi:MAG: hypothetical protein QF464_18945 [Myxococcota bacterium]|jgi:hypothetical protein|nr:hypothetical protein [Myxococcota bacterium]
MGFDELDDLLGEDDELEAAFRELDAQLKMDELRRQGPKRSARKGASGGGRSTTRKNTAADPLGDLKAAFDGGKKTSKATKKRPAKGPVKRYLVVVCPGCDAKNRVPLERLRKALPVCGRCKVDLSFER